MTNQYAMILDRADQVMDRAMKIGVRLQELDTRIRQTQEQKTDVENRHTRLLHDLEITAEATEYLKIMISMLSEKGLESLKNLLSQGLSTIFEGCGYSVDIRIDDHGQNKTAEFILVEPLANGEFRKTPLASSNGQGIVTMVSFILRIFFICHLNLRRFVIMDESLSQLSKEYVDGLFAFMRTLVDDLGFTFLMISHDQRFIPYADSVYEMNHGVIKRVRGGSDYE
jgi:DNA repair exonuclease SbcCD ATPase subunit